MTKKLMSSLSDSNVKTVPYEEERHSDISGLIDSFPPEFKAETFMAELFNANDAKYTANLNTFRRKVHEKVSIGDGDARINVPWGVSKEMVMEICTELKSRGFHAEYKKHRYRSHRPLRTLEVRLPVH
jgi:hypothetical protein